MVDEHSAQLDYACTGPGTLAGRYLRRFWHPVAVADRLAAGRAVPIRVMGEDFTLYRGEQGGVHVVANRCAHRGEQLSTGWVEGDCIRCIYHGWKYDGSGQCVEQPAEDGRLAKAIRIASCPTTEYLGLVWAYFGEGAPPPIRHIPQLEEEGQDLIRVTVGGGRLPFNYVNTLENDPAHVPFVHRNTEFFTDIPRVAAVETEYGSCETISTDERGRIGWVHRLMPNARLVNVGLREGGWAEFMLIFVPVDDASHAEFGVFLAHLPAAAHPALRQRMEHWQSDQAIADAAAILRGGMTMGDVDRTILLQVQDNTSQWGQGVVRDRSQERLTRSDTGLRLLRRIWDRELRTLAADGECKEWVITQRLALSSDYHG